MDSFESGCNNTEKQDKSIITATSNEQRSISARQKQLYDLGAKIPAPIKTNITICGGGGIAEPLKSATLTTPSTPRIELSRASSSSHHEDSRDSSPDNVFEQVGTGTLQEPIGLGFHEEGALELRSSTEELFFMDPEAKKEEQEKLHQQQIQQARRSSPIIFKFDEHQNYLQHHQRKDSASSEVAALLCISGRTSRVSSVGSQGSAISRLSAISGISRSPSPHRMLLETSFCGPKPLESSIADGGNVSIVEAPTAEILEQVLLSRKHDPTQAVFAEGIKIESSPQKKKPPTSISNGDTKRKSIDVANKPRSSRQTTSKTVSARNANRLTANKSPGQLVVGKTPSGSEYIRINLKPDHMYKDKGVAPNEKVVEVTVPGAEKQHKKPISLSLGRNSAIDEKRLTPSLSPKPSRHSALSKEGVGSRSPSPANVSVSRKSSFCSLFKLKDSPDSPKDRVRSRSKSRDRSTPQSQNPTPNKQKSVLAIFKPKRIEGKSKSSSPIDGDFDRHTPTGRVDSAMETFQSASSRPSSRLRYYDKPADGKGIHIPLHTPPEEKNVSKLLQETQTRPQSAPAFKESSSSKPSNAVKNKPKYVAPPQIPSDAIKPEQKVDRSPVAADVQTSSSSSSANPPQQNKVTKIQCIENLDAIHTLPQDIDEKEQTWSLEVHQHSSQDSQDTILSDNSLPNNCISKLNQPRTNLENLTENDIPDENGISAEVHRVPSETESIPHQAHQPFPEESMGQEKRRILFATRLGSGSQEQMFSTQFSLSKTESLSSQLSEHASIPENSVQEVLQRKDTILRRPDDSVATNKTTTASSTTNRSQILRNSSAASKSQSTSEDEKPAPTVAGILMRKKESMNEEARRKSSRSASEDDDVATHRHSRYLENFDVRRKLHENVTSARKSTSPSVMQQKKEDTIKMLAAECQDSVDSRHSREPVELLDQVPETITTTTTLPSNLASSESFGQPFHIPSFSAERQSCVSTDEPESSESERDSESDPHRLRRNLSHHIASAIEDHESTGLVSQDSFDDELPYIPTTLPEERAHGIALIPMKERLHMELKTCPLDRPRSTTPLNPSHLEEYCGIVAPEAGDLDHRPPVRGEKLRISLPKKDSNKDKAQKSKSPRRTSTSSGKSWFEFAEEAIRGPTIENNNNNKLLASIPKLPDDSQQAPPPPPEAPPIIAQANQNQAANNIRKLSDQWIDFQNIPEKRKAPKKITTLPKDTLVDNKTNMVVHYNYVKPEECQCECHEVERESSVLSHKSIASVDLLNPTNREDMQPLLEPETLESIDPSDSSREYSCYTDDETEGARTNEMETEEFPLRGLQHNSRNTKFPDNRYS